MNHQLVTRMGLEEDIDKLALLFDIANHGDVKRIWGAEAGEGGNWVDICRTHMLQPTSEVHFKKAVVTIVDGELAGALFFFGFTPSMPDGVAVETKPYLKPFLELRNVAPPGLLLRDMAVFPKFRGLGLARHMLDVAISTGFSAGLKHAVAVVHETNTLLLAHYYKRGMKVIASRDVVEHVQHKSDSKWLLLQLDAPLATANSEITEHTN